MSKYREDIKKIHDNTDFRVNFAGVTQLGEFVYEEHGGSVRPGLEYHVHYTNSKKEVFMTGGAHTRGSKIIQKVGGEKTLFSKYTDVKRLEKEEYPSITLASPTESDYRVGSLFRYFTRKENDINGKIFEVSQDDFDNPNVLFRYVDFKWRISGTKAEVTRDNSVTMNVIERELPGISRELFPLQYWKPIENSPDDIEKKLLFLRNP